MTLLQPSRRTQQPRRPGRLGTRALEYGVVVLLLVAWQVAATAVPSPFFPPPLSILTRAGEMLVGLPAGLAVTPLVTVDVAATLARTAAGFAIGAIVGAAGGLAVGRSRAARETSAPVVEFLRSVPATATLPLFIVLLGGDDAMRIAFIAFGVLWFVLINTANGVESVHATAVDMGVVFGLTRWQVWTRIILVAALPKIFAGLRIAATGALLLAVVSEFMLATDGIGYQLIQTQARWALRDMWVWIVLLALVGFVINTAIDLVQRSVLAWDRLSRNAA